jgi:hypothetical protein
LTCSVQLASAAEPAMVFAHGLWFPPALWPQADCERDTTAEVKTA